MRYNCLNMSSDSNEPLEQLATWSPGIVAVHVIIMIFISIATVAKDSLLLVGLLRLPTEKITMPASLDKGYDH